MLDQFWTREFGDSPPIANLLRDSFRDRWIRFHSLPDGQRYPTSDDELRDLLARHNSILSAITQEGKELWLLNTNFSPDPTPELTDPDLAYTAAQAVHWRSIAMHEIDTDLDPNYWHIFHSTTKWMPSTFDDVLQLVANDSVGNLMIVDPTESWLYHPYDGGADVILGSESERNKLAARFASWLSPRFDGL